VPKNKGMEFFRTKIRGRKILIDLQKYTPTGYPEKSAKSFKGYEIFVPKNKGM
jgi:hypothetical protein